MAAFNDQSAAASEEVDGGKRSFYRSTLWQVLAVGVISLVAPGLWNANSATGAGGQLEPYLVNAGNSIVFGLMGVGCVLAPIIVNKLGVKWTLVLGTLGWAPYSAALYTNNRYGTQWFVILGAVLCGASAGLYWASEGALILAYPEHRKRGRYLAIWLAFKNSGQIIGGAVLLAANVHANKGGKIGYQTYLAFTAVQCIGLPLAFLVSRPEKVQRDDGTKVKVETATSTKEQLRLLGKAVTTRPIAPLIPLFFASWFYWGYASTFLTLYFSVRARALASFLSAICGVIATTILGFFLDSQRISLRNRARYGALFTCTFFSGMLIWALVVQHDYTTNAPGKLDWEGFPRFGKGFGIYIMLNTAGNVLQNFLYWTVGSLGEGTSELTRFAGLLRGIESFGQCASFGINSSKFSPLYTVVINIVFWAVSAPLAWLSVRTIGLEQQAVVGSAESASSSEGTLPAEEEEKRAVEV